MLMMKLQWLIVLTLFVHNAWTYSLYDEFDDDDLWRRQTPSTEDGKRPECKKDILVLWDNSDSIGNTRYKDVFEFMKKLIRNKDLNVGEDGTHLGFITFSKGQSLDPGRAEQTKALKKYTSVLLKVGEIKDPEKIIDNLSGYNYDRDLKGDLTYTGSAFKLALNEFNQKSPKNHRDGIDDVILLFTDGEPNPDFTTEKYKTRRNKKADQTKPADKASKTLKENNVTIIGLAGGDEDGIKKFRSYIRRWSSPNQVFESKLEDLPKIVDLLVEDFCKPKTKPCQCKGNDSAVAYVKNEDSKLRFSWKKPKLSCGDGVIVPEPKVNPEGAESPMEYGTGRHKITYTFSPSSDDEKHSNVQCSVKVDIGVCKCPHVGPIDGEVKEGTTEAYVNWAEPKPKPCDTVPSPSNPQQTHGWYSAGEYTVPYTYTYKHPTNLNSFTMECPLKIRVTGKFCGGTAFNPDTHICCCGKPQKKKTFGDNCCGEENYNPDEKLCCPNDTLVSVGRYCS